MISYRRNKRRNQKVIEEIRRRNQKVPGIL
jgi:hypothetical protein